MVRNTVWVYVVITLTVWVLWKHTSSRTKNNMASSSKNKPWWEVRSLGLDLKTKKNVTFLESTEQRKLTYLHSCLDGNPWCGSMSSNPDISVPVQGWQKCPWHSETPNKDCICPSNSWWPLMKDKCIGSKTNKRGMVMTQNLLQALYSLF